MSPLAALLLLLPASPQAVEPAAILPLDVRAERIDGWLRTRLDTLVPTLMRREGIDTWVLVAREYDEDPVVETMLPATWLRARRRTILVFHDAGPQMGVERFSISRYDVGGLFPGAWNPTEEPDQWKRLASLLNERDPARIAVDRSRDFALADGLSSTEHEAFLAALPERLRSRVVSAEPLCVGWLETRTADELREYPGIVALAHRILGEGFRSVRPGGTTTDELEWWYRERVLELRLSTWFHPSVSVQRAGEDDDKVSFARRTGPRTIEPGDLVHVDFGITYLRLNTDTQWHAYVLAPGETGAPAGLRAALAVGNRLQDLLTGSFVAGRTGNQILKDTLAKAREAGIEATIYSHPLGFHGHGAGPTIGMWDQQDGVPGVGDVPLRASTAYAIELAATVPVPEWNGQRVKIQLEDDAVFDGETVRWLAGRQTEFFLIGEE